LAVAGGSGDFEHAPNAAATSKKTIRKIMVVGAREGAQG
jgi:hypothetical protein